MIDKSRQLSWHTIVSEAVKALKILPTECIQYGIHCVVLYSAVLNFNCQGLKGSDIVSKWDLSIYSPLKLYLE